MDKLQHIDQLLRSAAQEPANAFVFDADWDVIEKKLGRRKNRIFALWFFLALISISLTGTVFYSATHTNLIHTITATQKTNDKAVNHRPTIDLPQIDEPHSSVTNFKTKELDYTSVPITATKPHTLITLDSQITSNQEQKFSNLSVMHASPLINRIALESLYNWNIEELDYLINLELVNSVHSSGKKIDLSLNDKSHWEVGPAFTPSLSGRFLTENKRNPNLINPFYNSLVANSEKITFSKSYGINLQYHSESHFYFSSGLFISQRGEKVDYNYLITNFENRISGVVSSYSELKPSAYEKVEYSGSNSYHFIEIPLNVGYIQAISSKFEFRSQVGLSYMILNQSQGKKGDPVSLRLNDLTSLNFNTQNIAANIKTGIFFTNKNMAIGLEPMFGTNLNTLDQNTSLIKTKPYSCGINLSTNFKIYKK